MEAAQRNGWQPGRVLEELAFVYLSGDDVAAELPRYVHHRAASVVGRWDV